MRIAIATIGRFHVLDLARELDKLGHEVRFYTAVPLSRAKRFGLSRKNHRFLPELLPLVAMQRIGPKSLQENLTRTLYAAADHAVKVRLEPCDVFIGMSGVMLEAALHARRKYGARIFIERGSRHILSQAEILRAIAGSETVPQFAIERELEGYEVADKIVIPSLHVERSFLELGVRASRLFRNPYGVDVDHFRPPIGVVHQEENEIAFVGRWSLRKGCDLLTRVVLDHTRLSLRHAGSIGDIAFPASARFKSVGHIDQGNLRDFYHEAKLIVLPSREEGLSLVLIQALACGTPILCSDRSGGEDLKALISCPDAVSVIPVDDEDCLAESLETVLNATSHLRGRDLLGEQGRASLSWRAYGQRYENCLLRH